MATNDKLNKFSSELKKELSKLYDKKVFDSLIEIIDKTSCDLTDQDDALEIHFYGMQISKNDDRKLVPLCSLGPGRTLEGKYSGVCFGIIPELSPDIEVKLQVVKREKGEGDRTL